MCLPVLRQRMDEPISRQEQFQPLQEAAGRLGWTVVAILYRGVVSDWQRSLRRAGLGATPRSPTPHASPPATRAMIPFKQQRPKRTRIFEIRQCHHGCQRDS